MGIALIFLFLTASIEGRLWNPVSGAPVRKADVVVGTVDGTQVKRAISDVNGRYVVSGLAAGRYRVAAGRAGYLPALSNTVVSLKADEARHDLNIAMEMPATISGHVFDAEGDPVEHVTVVALSSANERVAQKGTNETNDRGEYRIAGLTAGGYLLRTTQKENYAPVFYPEANDFEGARPVNLALGSEARDIDLRVRQAAVGEISGTVHGPSRQTVRITVSRKSIDSVMSAIVEHATDMVTENRFVFPKLAPGTYVVAAWMEQFGNRLLWASQEIAVNGASVQTELTIAPTQELLAEVNGPAVIMLKRVNGFHSEARVAGAGNVVLPNITPGTWDLEIVPTSPDSIVDSVRWGTRELLGKPIDIGDGPLPKLQIHIHAGAVTKRDGKS